jgi:membrane-bound lytic murein transglycosylase B
MRLSAVVVWVVTILGFLVGAVVPDLCGSAEKASQESKRKKGEFQTWLLELKKEARSAGISQATLEAAFKGVAPIARVVELDRSQPEVKLTLEEYINRLVGEPRISKGRERLSEYRPLLEKVDEKYGIPPHVIVALWGVESDYGRLPGNFSVVGATATLAFDGRRGAYFRKELLLALKILEQGHITVDRMTGSWAGAMGHFQFMPSTFASYAVDYDGDGRKDIWENDEDAIASAANYLARMGWDPGQPWGLEVWLPENMDTSLIGPERKKRLSQWQALGVRRVGGRDLPDDADWEGAVVAPRWPDGRAFLVSKNERAIYRWNPSHSFAISVGLLSDRIGEK